MGSPDAVAANKCGVSKELAALDSSAEAPMASREADALGSLGTTVT